jgi:hypothetical protein
MEVWMFWCPTIEDVVNDLREAGKLPFYDVIEFDVLEEIVVHITFKVWNRA